MVMCSTQVISKFGGSGMVQLVGTVWFNLRDQHE